MRKKVLFILLFILSLQIKAQQFTQVTSANFVQLGNSKSIFADFDNDSYLDIFICGTNNMNQDTSILYRNNGDSTFTDMLVPFPGVDYGSAACGDYDKDGDIDLLLSGRNNITNRITHLYRNDGNFNFSKTSDMFTGLAYSSVSFQDYDNDGDFDILTCGEDSNNNKVTIIYQNTGSVYTADTIQNLAGLSQGEAAWGDYNNDSYSDLILTGSDNTNTRITRIYKNNGDKTFTALNVPGLTNITSSSVAWGDYDSDGDLDILIAGLDNLNNTICRIFKNTGANTFNVVSTAVLTGISSASVSWGDFDNDGLYDILANGFDGTLANTKVYRNNGNHTFTSLTFSAAGLPHVFSGNSIWGDFDKDSDLDVFITGFGITGIVSKLYRNTATVSNSAPSAPNGLSSISNDDKVYLKWNPSSDNSTPVKALTYNLWIGTSKTNVSVLSPNSVSATGLRKIVSLGNEFGDTSAFIRNLPQGKYYWSVQSIDNAYEGSAFAPTDSFSICRKFSIGKDTVVCYKDTIVLSAGAPGETVNWFESGGVGILAVNQRQVKVEVTVRDTIWANVINSVAGCSTFDTIVVEANPSSIISAGQDTAICLNKTIVLGGKPTASGSLLPYIYHWSPGQFLNDSTIANPVASIDTFETFRLIVKAGNCKGDTAFISVMVNDLPIVTASSDTTIGPGEPVELNASGAVTYSWSPATHLTNPLVRNPIASPVETTEYIVKGKDSNGCEDTASIVINVINRIFIPSLFSPDNNGSNDQFKIYGAGIKEIYFRIYNRMGQEVFSSDNIDKLLHEGWDGKYNGESLASQTLIWSMEGKFFDGSDITYKGKKTGTLLLKR